MTHPQTHAADMQMRQRSATSAEGTDRQSSYEVVYLKRLPWYDGQAFLSSAGAQLERQPHSAVARVHT